MEKLVSWMALLKDLVKIILSLYYSYWYIGSINYEIDVIFMIYILFPNKTKIVYERLFSTIKTHIPNFKSWVTYIRFCYIRLVVFQSIKQIFLNSELYGYNFNQSLWRKVQSISLSSNYKDDADIRLHVRMYSA